MNIQIEFNAAETTVLAKLIRARMTELLARPESQERDEEATILASISEKNIQAILHGPKAALN